MAKQKDIEKQQFIADSARGMIMLRPKGSRGKPPNGLSANYLYEKLKGTDLSSSKETIYRIYNEQLAEYRKEKFGQINYNNLPESKTDIENEYSFVVRRGWLQEITYDENGKKHIQYATDDNGDRIGNFVTVRTDRKLKRKEIREASDSMPRIRDCRTGDVQLQISNDFAIIRRVRRKMRV